MPTDTIYGVVGRAKNKETVERIYQLRRRAPNKPCVILIGGINELEKFSIILSVKQKMILEKYWPVAPKTKKVGESRPVSIVLDCPAEKFTYLHRGAETLAFRLPASKTLQELLFKVGPLIAPSANLEGLPAAQTIKEAKKYFGNSVDLYVDGGLAVGRASKIIKLHKDRTVSILRA